MTAKIKSKVRATDKRAQGLQKDKIRRLLSVTAVKAQVGCLLGRLHQVGPGNKQLAKKREWALLQDNRMKRERHSQWIRKIEGVNTLRRGMIKVA